MKAEIFSIGTELLMGELTDTNSAWLAARLPALGVELQGVSIIGDSLAMLTAGFTRALQRAVLVLTTGGLGPTQDDLTREAIAAALQETPTVQEEALKELERYFQQRGRSMPAPNIKQAHLIPSAQFLPNPLGTAPGWWVERHGKIVVAMPGPPAEMHPMWDEQVEPRLRQLVTGDVTITRNIKTMGLSEAAVDESIAEFFGHENPYYLVDALYRKPYAMALRLKRVWCGLAMPGWPVFFSSPLPVSPTPGGHRLLVVSWARDTRADIPLPHLISHGIKHVPGAHAVRHRRWHNDLITVRSIG